MRGQLLAPGDLLQSSDATLQVIVSNFATLGWATRRMKAYRKQRRLRYLLVDDGDVAVRLHRPAHREHDDVIVWDADER